MMVDLLYGQRMARLGGTVFVVGLWWVNFATATIVQQNFTSTVSETNFPGSASDLVNIGSPALSAEFHQDYTPFSFDGGTSSVTSLNDGWVGIPTSVGAGAALSTSAFDGDGVGGPGVWGWTSTYTFVRSAFITNVSIYAGWIAQRANILVELQVSTEGDPSFVSLGTFTNAFTGSGAAKTVLTDDGGYLGSSVDQIRFIFKDSPSLEEGVYREVDVFGFIVPEPNVLLLSLVGGWAAFGLRRRPSNG